MSSAADESTALTSTEAWNASLSTVADRIIKETADPKDTTEQSLEDALSKVDGLTEALHTRTIIGQATGWLMRDRGITTDAAFDLLVQISSEQELKVRVIAAQIVAEANRSAPGA